MAENLFGQDRSCSRQQRSFPFDHSSTAAYGSVCLPDDDTWNRAVPFYTKSESVGKWVTYKNVSFKKH